MDISEIQNLMQQGDYNRVGEEEKLDGLILKSRILEIKGELKEALTAAKHVIKESKSKGTKLQELGAIISLGYCHLAFRNTDELSEVIKEGEQLLQGIGKELQHEKKEYQGSLNYLNGFLYYLKGDTKQALDYLQKSLALRGGTGNTPELAETIIAIGWVHANATGKYDLALEYFQRSLAIGEELGNNMTIAHSLNRIGVYYGYSGNLDAALSYYEKSLTLYQELDNKFLIVGRCLHNMAVAYSGKEEYSLALDYFQQALEYDEELGNKFSEALTGSNIGWLHLQRGEFNLALDFFQRSLRLFEDLGHKGYVADQLGNIGLTYSFKGDLDLALDYSNKALKKSKEAGNEIRVAYSILTISMAYNLKGEPNLALDNVNESLRKFTKLNNNEGVANCLRQKGIIYKLLGEFDLAIKYLEEGWELYKQTLIGGSLAPWGSFFLFHLILVAQGLEELGRAKEYLNEMQEITQNNKSRLVQLRFRFAEAIVLKMSTRIALKFQAQQKLQTIVDEKLIDNNITMLAIWNLCELLILEIKISEAEEDLFQEVTKLSTMLYDIAQSQNSLLVITMALILKTKLTLVEGKVEEASNLLSTAKRIAEEKKLLYLLPKVKFEQETIQSELDKWEELFERKASIQERLKQARVENYIVEAKRIQEAWVRPSADTFNQ
jgi:tetratricopeptide (TPR) repeat protein